MSIHLVFEMQRLFVRRREYGSCVQHIHIYIYAYIIRDSDAAADERNALTIHVDKIRTCEYIYYCVYTRMLCTALLGVCIEKRVLYQKNVFEQCCRALSTGVNQTRNAFPRHTVRQLVRSTYTIKYVILRYSIDRLGRTI